MRQEKSFVLFLLLLVVLMAVPSGVSAYGVDTHAFLTGESFEFYNSQTDGARLSNELKNFFIDGARREDDHPRYFNHFYDPVYDRGLESVYGDGMKSKEWAESDEAQTAFKYEPTIASILSAVEERKIQNFLSASNYSWNEAIRYWLDGDREMAMFALGHIVHLIQDGSVPDHTRNDPHPGGADSSPYENWTAQFTLGNPDAELLTRAGTAGLLRLDTLGDYFNSITNYSNNNFYSRDTVGIQSGYNSPEPDDFERDGDLYIAIGENGTDRYPLYMQTVNSSIVFKSEEEIIFDDLVMDAYWSRLSVKAVQHGAGVIDLFFKEVERAENDPQFSRKHTTSFFANVYGSVQEAVSAAVQAIYDLFDTEDGGYAGNDSYDNLGNDLPMPGQQTASVLSAVQDSGGGQEGTSGAGVSAESNFDAPRWEEPKFEDINEEDGFSVLAQIPLDASPSAPIDSGVPAALEVAPLPTPCSFNSRASKNSNPPVILSEIAWMGTAESSNNEWIELMNRSGGTVDIGGWQIIDASEQIKISIKPGTILTNASQYYLFERTDDDSVPKVSADEIYVGALSNSDEGLRLFDSTCNLVDEVFASSDWPAGSGPEKRTMERSHSNLSWHTYTGPIDSVSGLFGTPRTSNSYPQSSGSSGGGVVQASSAPPPPPIVEAEATSQNTSSEPDAVEETEEVALESPDLPIIPEPVQNFSVVFDPDSMGLFFDWSSSTALTTDSSTDNASGSLAYALYSINSPRTLVATTSETHYEMRTSDIGKELHYQIVAYDDEGSESLPIDAYITPSLIDSFEFYNDYAESDPRPVVDLRFSHYPFFRNTFGYENSWKMIAFYLNGAEPQATVSTDSLWEPSAEHPAILVSYQPCSGVPRFRKSLILADDGSRCTNEISVGAAATGPGFEDERILLPAEHPDGTVFTSDDYVTIAYYALSHAGGGNHNFSLVVTDNRKFYFDSDGIGNLPPSAPTNLVATVDEDYNLSFVWDASHDLDDIDSTLTYEVNITPASGEPADLIGALNPEYWRSTTPAVVAEPGNGLILAVRAHDPHGNVSDVSAIYFDSQFYEFPTHPIPYDVSDVRWGHLDPLSPENIQITFKFKQYPFVAPGDWPSDDPLTAVVFNLNRKTYGSYQFIARPEYTSSLNIGEGVSRLMVSYPNCDGDTVTVGGVVMHAGDGCGWRGDTIGRDYIQLPVVSEAEPPTETEWGSMTIDVTGTLESPKSLEELTSLDYITLNFFSAYNGGIPRGTFGNAGVDKNRYHFEP